VDELRLLFESAGIRASVQLLEPRELAARVRLLRQNNEPVVAVGGGDGSVSAVAAALAESTTALLPVPLGTRNHFAHRFGLASLKDVATVLHSGRLAVVATGRVNGRSFVNNVSCGYYPEFVRQRERLRPLISSGPADVLAFFLALAGRPLMNLELAVDDRLLVQQTTALWIGIGKHSLQLPARAAARRAGDFLEAVWPRPLSRSRLLITAIQVWRQLRAEQELRHSRLQLLRAPAFTVNSDRPIDLAVDGEIYRWVGPLRLEYRRDALRVFSLVVRGY
jgi:diacylglycerol kinase family enzyme